MVDLTQHGTGPMLEMIHDTDTKSTWADLSLHGNTGSGAACIEYHNRETLPSNSASRMYFRDLRLNGCGADGIHITGIKPPGGEGNTYGTTLYRVSATWGMASGLHLDSISSAGAAGTTINNILASTFAANAAYGIFFDTTRTSTPTAHGLTNVIGTDLEGNMLAAVRADSVNNLNLWGNYVEQVTAVPALIDSANHRALQGPWTLLGNSLGNSDATKPNYCVDLGTFPAGLGTSGVLSAGNLTCHPSVAVYRIAGLVGAQIGPDRQTDATSMVDWSNTVGVKMVQVWDVQHGTWSFFSDRYNFVDQPHVGLGVKGPDTMAYLHVAGTKPYQSAINGTTPVDVLRLDGPAGGNTTGTTGQTAGQGSGVRIVLGDGGTAPVGSVTGAGGDFSLVAGSPGIGGGTPGRVGRISLGGAGNALGFLGAPPVARPIVTGSWSDGSAAQSVLAALAKLGLAVDGTTP